MASQEQTLPAGVRRFIDHMHTHKSVSEAAKKAKISLAEAKRAMLNPIVLRALERRDELVVREQARLKAKQKKLDTTFIDAQLLECVSLPAVTHGHVKLKAIEQAYRRVGILVEGEFVSTTNPEGATNSRPQIFQGLRSTVRRTVTEEIQHTHESVIATDEVLEY